MLRTSVALLTCLLVAGQACAADDLFDGFNDGWRQQWQEQSYFTRPTRYSVVTDAGRPVLQATSSSAHAGLARRIGLLAPTNAILSWRWKVRSSLTANRQERTRAGDDYAARVCVVFETSLWPLRTRALNYVWAAHEPAGAVYPSPYSRNVGMFVLRAGDSDAGRWRAERRDVLADYQRYFGQPATQISAVAVLVDTDNTGGEAEAWFAKLALDSSRQ